jgi:predicted PurR-regulated permease PerM
MVEKQIKKAVIVITIILVGLFIGLVSQAGAETNQTIPEPKPFHFKLQNWAQSEWNDIKEYQAKNWADGKAQLNQNQEQISNLFQTIADAISNVVTTNKQ